MPYARTGEDTILGLSLASETIDDQDLTNPSFPGHLSLYHKA